MEAAMRAQRTTWTVEEASWHGEFAGGSLGSDTSIIFTRLDQPGSGPVLHRHPYSETFIVQRGTVVFFDGIAEIEASAGEIIVIPPGTPHRFAAKSGTVEMIDIHASGRFITEWLEDRAGELTW
jgi:quercetin dioxygenase-like cupin family protein